MASVQTNIRLPKDVKDWLQDKAVEDGRTKGEVLARIIRPIMAEKQAGLLKMNCDEMLRKTVNNMPRAASFEVEGDAHKQQSLIPKPEKKAAWTPPEGINLAAWAEFEQHRKSIRKPLSDIARTKAAKSIINLSHDEQQSTIDRSIQAGWAGLFPEKNNKSKISQIEANHKSLKEELFGADDSSTFDGECHEQH